MFLFVFFFFKQKTAYEMRISDWSSDVCSSDLVDLLFTDIVMPDMNGRALADKARESRPELKVLYTTGYTRNAIVHNGMLDADVAFLPKPFTIEQLGTKVRQVLDGQGANRRG